MAKRIVHLPQRPVAAVDMGDGDVAQMRRRRRRERLHAVSDHQHDIRLEPLRVPGPGPRRRGPSPTARLVPRHGTTASTCDSIDRPAMPRIEVHSRCDDLQMQPAVRPDRLQNRLHQSELGPRARDEADAAARRSGIFTRHRRSACQLSISPALMKCPVRCPMIDGHAEAGMPVPGRCTSEIAFPNDDGPPPDRAGDEALPADRAHVALDVQHPLAFPFRAICSARRTSFT